MTGNCKDTVKVTFPFISQIRHFPKNLLIKWN